MITEKKWTFFSKEMDNELKKRVDLLTKVYLVKNRKKLIDEFIKENFCKLMGNDRPLTSKEVMDMLQISRATFSRRIKLGKLKPINPNEKVHRFLRSEVINFINSGKK